MLGGVAAGVARYFNTDINVVRLLMVLAAFFTGGAFIAVYLVLWLLLPTVTSTSTDVGGIMQENLNEMAGRAGFRGSNPNVGNTGAAAQGPNGGQPNSYSQAQTPQTPQAGTNSTAFTPSIGAIVLITLGGLLLLGNFGIFHVFGWRFFWPLVLVGLGVLLLVRKR
jgi:phage shock protein PspC (stress-responsive transcriptional regulator)